MENRLSNVNKEMKFRYFLIFIFLSTMLDRIMSPSKIYTSSSSDPMNMLFTWLNTIYIYICRWDEIKDTEMVCLSWIATLLAYMSQWVPEGSRVWESQGNCLPKLLEGTQSRSYLDLGTCVLPKEKIINWYCFKPLSLQLFIIAAIRNLHILTHSKSKLKKWKGIIPQTLYTLL